MWSSSALLMRQLLRHNRETCSLNTDFRAVYNGPILRLHEVEKNVWMADEVTLVRTGEWMDKQYRNSKPGRTPEVVYKSLFTWELCNCAWCVSWIFQNSGFIPWVY